MGLLDSKTRSVVGLDIEPGFLAAAEFSTGGTPSLVRAATESLGPGLFHEGEVVDVDGLADRVRAFFREHDLPKRIRLGVASQKIALRVLELPVIHNEQELEAAVRFQAQEELPMPLEQAVLDYHVLERVDNGEGGRMRVVVVGARRDTVEHLLAVARKAGLQPELVDLSAFAMIRALAPAGADASSSGAMLYVNVAGLTNIAVAHGYTCLFTRTVAGGYDGLAGELAERCGLTLQHARQWLVHVGLVAPMSDVTGDEAIVAEARNVLSDGVRRIADEARNSLDFYRAAPDALGVEEAILCGPAVTVPGFVEELGARIGVPVREGAVAEARPGALADIDADRVAIAAGLATEERRA